MSDEVVAYGLDGIVVSESAIGRVNANEGYYQYRQYDAVTLNLARSYEDIWFLMLNGNLPQADKAQSFAKRINSYHLSSTTLSTMRALTHGANEDSILKLMAASLAAIGSEAGFKATLDCSQDEIKDQVIHMCALAPIALAALYRMINGLDPIDHLPEQSCAWNYLYMLQGKEPEKQHVWAIERYMNSVIDHGFNASTFTSRVVTSTGADVASAIVGAIGSLSGPLHGGAPSRVLDMLDEIGQPENIDSWVKKTLSSNNKIMGFGHRIYKDEDPRSDLMKSVAEKVGSDRVNLALQAEKAILRILSEEKAGRKICTNVEYFSSVVMEACGLPRTLFTPTFMVARMIGWGAHIIEQAAFNRIYRPRSKYVGPAYTKEIPS